MSLRPLTAHEFSITTPESVAAQWSRLGLGLSALIEDCQGRGQWHRQRLAGLSTAHQLFIEMSAAAAVEPIATWHLMAATLRELATHSEGGYMVGIADAALLQLDATDIKPRRGAH